MINILTYWQHCSHQKLLDKSTSSYYCFSDVAFLCFLHIRDNHGRLRVERGERGPPSGVHGRPQTSW